MQYNGCKWKGSVLRLEKAKPIFSERLKREWTDAEQKQKEEAERALLCKPKIDEPIAGTFEALWVLARDVRQVTKMHACHWP